MLLEVLAPLQVLDARQRGGRGNLDCRGFTIKASQNRMGMGP